MPVGWHIWHNNSFNPIYRAEQDLQELSKYSDFIKVVMYNNCGGERMALYADNIGSTLYGDLSKQGPIDLNYALLEFKEGGYDQIPHTGLSADYVYRRNVHWRCHSYGRKRLGRLARGQPHDSV